MAVRVGYECSQSAPQQPAVGGVSYQLSNLNQSVRELSEVVVFLHETLSSVLKQENTKEDGRSCCEVAPVPGSGVSVAIFGANDGLRSSIAELRKLIERVDL
jgi:hypothetical protein